MGVPVPPRKYKKRKTSLNEIIYWTLMFIFLGIFSYLMMNALEKMALSGIL